MENIRIKAIIAAIITIIIILATYILIYYFGTDPNANRIVYNTKYNKKDLLSSSNVSLESINNSCIEYMEIAGIIIVNEVLYNSCSLTKPDYCNDGKLVSNCALCGCEALETCNKNGDCEAQSTGSIGGGGGAAGGEEEGGAGGAGGAGPGGAAGGESSSGCTDSDVSALPNPVFASGSCTDTTGSYNDECKDPQTRNPSVIYVEEYKCQGSGNASACIGNFKSCPSNAETYFGSPSSECQSNKCQTPQIIVNATCFDGIKNQDETNIDCGGVCSGYWYLNSCHATPQIIVNATCFDGVKNQDETNIDCGGVCNGYWYLNSCHATPQIIVNATCSDGIKNQNEEGVDCGGVCQLCQEEGGGGIQAPLCNALPIDSFGLTIFSPSVCNDDNGNFSNVCASPIGGEASDIFIKTYVCISDKCTPKYYSCQVKGEDIYGDENYRCINNMCRT